MGQNIEFWMYLIIIIMFRVWDVAIYGRSNMVGGILYLPLP